MRQYQVTATNRSKSQGHVKTPDHILVSDLPNRSQRDRVAPMTTLATQQRSSHRVSQSLLACVPCFAAVPFCQISWFMRLLRGWDCRASVRCSMLLASDTQKQVRTWDPAETLVCGIGTSTSCSAISFVSSTVICGTGASTFCSTKSSCSPCANVQLHPSSQRPAM